MPTPHFRLYCCHTLESFQGTASYAVVYRFKTTWATRMSQMGRFTVTCDTYVSLYALLLTLVTTLYVDSMGLHQVCTPYRIAMGQASSVLRYTVLSSH